MDDKIVNGELNSDSETANLQLTSSPKDPIADVPQEEVKRSQGSQDLADKFNNREDVQERLSEKESLVLPRLNKLNAELRASQDSLDKVPESAGGEQLPVDSKDPEELAQPNTFIPIGSEERNNGPESFYLNRDAEQEVLSDSGSYTDSLEPDENIPHVHLLPRRDPTTSDQPEADQVVETEATPTTEATETVVKRNRRRKSRLPVPKGMANVKKEAAPKDEKATSVDTKENLTKDKTETGAKKNDKVPQEEQITDDKPTKGIENVDPADVTERSVPPPTTVKSEANGIGSDKSSEQLSQTCEPDAPTTEATKPEGDHKTQSTPKCQRSQSIDEKSSGSKNSSRSSISRRETIDMGDTKPTCAARTLKETKMDLYMNSNEGLLIPHQQTSPAGAPVLRDTISSRLRIEKAHNEHLEPDKSPLDYLTPFQRKEHAIKDLKRQMKNLNKVLDDKNSEIAQLREGLGKESQDLLKAKDDQMSEVQKQLDETESKYEELKRSYEESVKTVINLEATVKDLKDSIAEQNRKNESLYLEMYLKGQDAARYEREEEIEQMAGTVNDKVFKKTSTVPEVNVKELLAKLNRTQAELAKWQSLRREEAYQEVERPETEAEATLRFLRDSFFHYITDHKGQDDHMRAMIQIFKFTEVQKKKITKGLLEKKTKKT